MTTLALAALAAMLTTVPATSPAGQGQIDADTLGATAVPNAPAVYPDASAEAPREGAPVRAALPVPAPSDDERRQADAERSREITEQQAQERTWSGP